VYGVYDGRRDDSDGRPHRRDPTISPEEVKRIDPERPHPASNLPKGLGDGSHLLDSARVSWLMAS
jgi:hypothetical protein